MFGASNLFLAQCPVINYLTNYAVTSSQPITHIVYVLKFSYVQKIYVAKLQIRLERWNVERTRKVMIWIPQQMGCYV